LFFSGYGIEHIVQQLEIHEAMHAVFFGETLNRIIFVLPDTLYQVASHANVKRAVALAGWLGCKGLVAWLNVLR
jgi:hypothetical protein